jgi:hypothetical protein
MADKMFEIEIREVLSRVIKVTSKTQTDAILKVQEMYRNEEIVLDAGDYISTEFKVSRDNLIIDMEKLSNGNNFYLIDEKFLYFWGLDIKQRKIKLNKKIRLFIESHKLSINEVCEFIQDEDFELFEFLY